MRDRLHALDGRRTAGRRALGRSRARATVALITRRSTSPAQLSALLEAQSCAWILTSATLAVGDDFSHFKRRSGLAERGDRALREPVRFSEPGAAVPAEGTRRAGGAGPHARRDQRSRCRCSRRVAGVRSCCSRVIARCARRADELCRHWGIEPAVSGADPGRRSRDQLLRTFREAGNAVLLGTGSFWEGVDVKGDALSRGRDRQAAVRDTRRSAAEGAARRRSRRRAAIRFSTSRCRRPSSR